MITHRTTNLLEQPDLDVIVHQCNCFHTMGAGITLNLRQKWPEVFEADKLTPYGDINKLGTFSKATVAKTGLWIYNLYSQFRYGRDKRYTDYDAVRKGMMLIIQDLNNTSLVEYVIKIGIPYKMGCKNAGGDWHTVYDILHDIYGENDKYMIVICGKDC